MTRLDDIPATSSLRMDVSSVTRPTRMPLRIISFNIRFANEHPEPGEHLWALRGPRLVNQLNFITAGHESPFICLQECLYEQIEDIQTRLGDDWGHVFRGRGTGEKDGEACPIFYRKSTWRLDHTETRWLSETPDRPSRGWDAALNRIVTMGRFSHLLTGTRVIVMCTHFDHLGVEARRQSAKLLIKFAREWSSVDNPSMPPSPAAVLVAGDFNSPSDDGAYQEMTAPGSGMTDVSTLVAASKHYGNTITYTSFGEPAYWPMRIDYLFIQRPNSARINTFGVLANSFDDQIRVSDHRAVVSDMDIVI